MAGSTLSSSISVGSQTDLNNAIDAIEQNATSGNYEIKFTNDIQEGDSGQPAGVYAIVLPNDVTLTIDGNGFALEGEGDNSGLAVISGQVTIENLTIEDTIAQGNDGEGSGGGGAGLGGGLFVGQSASVIARSLTFQTDTAKGGNGGTGGGGGAGGNASPIFDPNLGPAGAAGSSGARGSFSFNATGGPGGDGTPGSQGSIGEPSGQGGDGGDGAPGGGGPFTGNAPGLDGGDGGNGATGGLGVIGGAGGDGGDGGGGGVGGDGGFPPGTSTRSNIHSFGGFETLSQTRTTGGADGFDAGNGADGGDGAKGGDGGYLSGGGGGGSGGDGGGQAFVAPAVVFAGSIPASFAGMTGGGGARADQQTTFVGGGSNTVHITPMGDGFDGADGGDGGNGGNGEDGGDGGFGAGGGGGGNGGAGGIGGNGGDGGPGASNGYIAEFGLTNSLPTPGAASDGGDGGDGGNGGDGGDGADGGKGGFGGGGGGGGNAGAAGAGGSGGLGGSGGTEFTFVRNTPNFMSGGRTFGQGQTGNSGNPGSDGQSGNAGNGAEGGFGGGAGSNGGMGGGGLGAGGDIFVAAGGRLILDGGLLTGGTAAGGQGANPGSDHFGDGIFLQGNEFITLGASSGRTLVVDDQIMDQTGAGGTGTNAGTGGLIIAGSGTVELDHNNAFEGGVQIDSGTLDLATQGAAGSGPISFAAAPVIDPTLQFTVAAAPTQAIENFGPNDDIVIESFINTTDTYSGGELTLHGLDGITPEEVSLQIPGFTSVSQFQITSDPLTDTTTITTAPCYCAGTLIDTLHGRKPVETLRIGDKVMTLTGVARPIKWIGRRSYAGRFVMGRSDILPICIKAGALDENVPQRDLWVSPNHAMALDGVLIEARDLLNGVSIVQAEQIDKVEYFHIELDSHDVVLAEGAAAETFIDDDSRGMFHNASEYRATDPDEAAPAARYCAPRLSAGYRVEAARRRIALRAGIGTAHDKPGTLRGYVDHVGPHRIGGWAQDAEYPETPVCLHIYADGRIIGEALANQHHDDPQQAGRGSGCHGFTFTPPDGIVMTPDTVEVRRALDGEPLLASSGNADIATRKGRAA